ncbi:MAG: two pore domain potassium channel family protein [Arenimonas sp.]|nr:two pore domain potassium channel family protein [Arenimonas sp.]MBP7982007.1 two pore domain potassium channel family protein [Arenimonas sp.]
MPDRHTFSEQLMSRRFMQLFVCIMLMLFLQAALKPSLFLAGVAALLYLNLMLVAVSGTQAGRRARMAIFLVWFACALSRVLVAREYSLELYLVSKTITALLLGMGVFHILRLILTRKRVTTDTLFASVVVYVLTALLFANLYAIADAAIANSLTYPDHFMKVDGHLGEVAYTYFSFVTIATLGYGDVLPAVPLTQMMVSMQAVIGQFYVAVLVAWLVSLYIAHKNGGD